MSSLSGLLLLASMALAGADSTACMRAAAGMDTCSNPMTGCTKGSDCQTALSSVSSACKGLTDTESQAMIQTVTGFQESCSFLSDPCISTIMAMSTAGETCSNPAVDCPAGTCTAGNALVSKCGAGWEMPAVPALMRSMSDSINASVVAKQVALLKAAGCNGNSRGSTSTATTTASPVVITGSIDMTGISAASINGNATLKAAVASGIADTLGVPSSYVQISVSRRLNEQRQLSESAKVSYTITIPHTSSVSAGTVAAKLDSNSITTSLQSHVQSSLASTGASVTVTVASVTVVTTTTAAPKASWAVGVKFSLPLIFLAVSLL